MNVYPKILRYIFAVALLWSWSSCDEIEPPYMTDEQGSQNGDDEVVVRKMLLEEFTGHRCPNCPEGTQVAKTLNDFYGDDLILISIHAGWYATPLGSDFSYDFRTPEGEALNDYFGIEQNPVGVVSRIEYENSMLVSPSAWGSAMVDIAQMAPDMAIYPSVTLQSGSNYELDVDVRILNDLEEDHYLVAVVTESGIIKPQMVNDDDQYPDGIIMDYEHNHVLRTGITDIWGDQLNDTPIAVDDMFTRNYTFTLDEEWVADNCHLVVYVMNQYLEVIQVEEIGLME